jgi:2-methylisocitrate lyase-like PEP mutase family enzyme
MIAQPGIIRAPGAVDALSAKLVEKAGFEAVHMTGGGIARSLGYPDVGLVTMTEAVERARSIARAVAIPVIADGDTGYGNAINLIRTIEEFEDAGVAAIHIEDQVTPKRCGHLSGTTLVSTAEMVRKIEAARAARRDPDFAIIARTDARLVEGLDSAIERAISYHRAGADVIFIEEPQTLDEIKALPRMVAAPLLINMFSGGRTPPVGAADLRSFGYKVVVYPSHLQRASIRAMQRALALLMREDSTAASDDELMVSFAERDELVGLSGVADLEKAFLTD